MCIIQSIVTGYCKWLVTHLLSSSISGTGSHCLSWKRAGFVVVLFEILNPNWFFLHKKNTDRAQRHTAPSSTTSSLMSSLDIRGFFSAAAVFLSIDLLLPCDVKARLRSSWLPGLALPVTAEPPLPITSLSSFSEETKLSWRCSVITAALSTTQSRLHLKNVHCAEKTSQNSVLHISNNLQKRRLSALTESQMQAATFQKTSF